MIDKPTVLPIIRLAKAAHIRVANGVLDAGIGPG
jgi:hypothetical protein